MRITIIILVEGMVYMFRVKVFNKKQKVWTLASKFSSKSKGRGIFTKDYVHNYKFT